MRSAEDERQQRQGESRCLAGERQQQVVPGGLGASGDRHEKRFDERIEPVVRVQIELESVEKLREKMNRRWNVARRPTNLILAAPKISWILIRATHSLHQYGVQLTDQPQGNR